MRIWPFSGGRTPPTPRLRELLERLDDVEKSIDWLRKADKDLNARLSSVTRQIRSQDAPQETIASPEIVQYPPFTPRAVEPTAHLAQRFRRP